MSNKKRTVEIVKNELSKIDDKIEIMIEKVLVKLILNLTNYALNRLN